MARKVQKTQVNLNLRKSTNQYITRAAKRGGFTKAEIVEQAITIHKARGRETI